MMNDLQQNCMNSKSLVQTLQKVKNYAKNLKQQGMNSHPQQMSDTAILYDPNNFELPRSSTGGLGFHKTKSKMESMTTYKESSPAHSHLRPPSRQKGSFTMSCKFVIDRKEVQSQNQTTSNHKPENRIHIKNLDNFLNASEGSRDVSNKKAIHSHTYTRLNQDTDKLKEVENSFSAKEQNISKFRHSKSPSKERHPQNNNSISHGQQNFNLRMSDLNRVKMQMDPPPALINDSKRSQGKKHEIKIDDHNIAALLAQISHLQSIISKYKTVLLSMRHRYLAMEEQLKQKATHDHLMDVLKQKIEDLQDKNNGMNLQLKVQKDTISKYESTFINKIAEIHKHYASRVDQNIILRRENEMLRQILLISTQPNVYSINRQGTQPSQGGEDKNPFLRNMVKNVEAFSLKWV